MTLDLTNRLPNGAVVRTTDIRGAISEYRYETVVTPPFTDVAVYETIAEAISGHKAMIEKWTAKADGGTR